MKKIGILTYNHPHRKTQDVLMGLLMNGFKSNQITLIVQDWIGYPKKHPIYSHRPEPMWDVYPNDLPCHSIAYSIEVLNDFDIILLAGAGILRDINQVKPQIMNSHPGYLPNIRGLDALKWAIYLGQPIGVSLHVINKFFDIETFSNDEVNTSLVDTGILFERCIIPIHFEDTFHSVAQRVYEKEIQILVESVTKEYPTHITTQLQNLYPLRKRMPIYLEPVMIERFEKLRKSKNSKYCQ